MTFACDLGELVNLCSDAETPQAGWYSLVSYLSEQSNYEFAELRSVPIEADVQAVRAQLEKLIADEPPPRAVNAIYFGLFDCLDDSGHECIQYYVCGSDRYRVDEPDSLCRPAWWPEGRYLASLALDAIKKTEQWALEKNFSYEFCSFLGYAAELGAAMLISRFASDGLFVGLPRLVGHDSGDVAEIKRD